MQLKLYGAAAALLATTALAAIPPHDAWRGLTGCYRLKAGLWSAYATPGPESLPLYVRFDTEALGTFARGRLSPTVNTATQNFGTWERIGADSVRFGWRSDLTGEYLLQVRARMVGDSLVGTIISSHRPFAEMAGATAVHSVCPTGLR